MKRMPAEWEKQQCVLMSFPHEETDWHDPDNENVLENPSHLSFVLHKPSLMGKLCISSVKIKRRSRLCSVPHAI